METVIGKQRTMDKLSFFGHSVSLRGGTDSQPASPDSKVSTLPIIQMPPISSRRLSHPIHPNLIAHSLGPCATCSAEAKSKRIEKTLHRKAM